MTKEECIRLLEAQPRTSQYSSLGDSEQLAIMIRRAPVRAVRYGLFADFILAGSIEVREKRLLREFNSPDEADIELDKIRQVLDAFPNMRNCPYLTIEEVEERTDESERA